MDLDTNGWKIKQLLMQIGDRMKTLEWIDNADSWLCPVCRMEVSTPTKYNYHCPKCGFIAERNKRIATMNTLKYLKQDFTTIEPIEFFGNTYYQIGADDWNIVVGLGGLVEIVNQANKIIKDYMDKLA